MTYWNSYRPLKDIEQDNNKLMARNFELSGENSELKHQLEWAKRELKGNAGYIAYLKKQLKEKES
jgi:hypothetical protein